jgi:hypothetical protein
MSELSPEARALIDATVLSDEPSAADRARVADRISAQLGIAAATVVGVSATASPLGASAASESAFTSSAPGVLATAKTSLSAVIIKTMAAALAVAAVATTAIWALEPAALNSKRSKSTSEASPFPKGVGAAEPVRTAVTALAPEVGMDVLVPQAADSEPPRLPDSAREARTKKVRATLNAAHAQPASSGTLGSIERELGLMGSAQRALRESDPSTALQRAQEYLASFPHGALREEALAVQALAKCAQGAASEQTLREFDDKAPDSLLAPHVRAACSKGVK